MKIDLVLSLPLPQAQPRWSLALSESQTIKEAKAVEVSAVPKWALGAPGFCCLKEFDQKKIYLLGELCIEFFLWGAVSITALLRG